LAAISSPPSYKRGTSPTSSKISEKERTQELENFEADDLGSEEAPEFQQEKGGSGFASLATFSFVLSPSSLSY
jgi:hypothetical protein